MRKHIYSYYGLKDVYISKGCIIDNIYNVSIGAGSFIHVNVTFYLGADNSQRIELGRNVFVGPRVLFCCATHEIGGEDCRAGKNMYRSIYVEDGCWIGANVTLLPGTVIHKGSIIAAGAVVTGEVPENCVYGGVPAKLIRKL